VVFEQFGQLFLGVLESAGVAGVDYEGDGVDVRVEGAPVAAGPVLSRSSRSTGSVFALFGWGCSGFTFLR
jgi:hypothetical protein